MTDDEIFAEITARTADLATRYKIERFRVEPGNQPNEAVRFVQYESLDPTSDVRGYVVARLNNLDRPMIFVDRDVTPTLPGPGSWFERSNLDDIERALRDLLNLP